ncbi:SPX domain-domain-containing protein [Syncephalastrum racemosum]|uniref:SPX domain-domain-containing protein n=1 Tax=Syncephalastrum racemosum TaxID=13706 RepID=A0A1X2HPN9_SYNRA|nr:SPX domain-domain-containing protein [Syncephalastrum racemosum]
MLDRQLSFPHSLIRKVSSPFRGDNTELTRVSSRPVSIQSSATLSVLEEVLLHASDPERAFFHALNIELDKVALFYDEKEEEARTKLEALKIQMQLIAEYGSRIHDVQIRDEANHQDDPESQRAYHAPPHGIMGWFHRRRKTTAEDDILPEFHNTHLSSTVDYSADRHVSYNVARSRLKKALTEFHRSLEFLRSYKVFIKS